MSLWNFWRRQPKLGHDWSVTLPTTAETNQFHKYLEGKSSDNVINDVREAYEIMVGATIHSKMSSVIAEYDKAQAILKKILERNSNG